MVLVLVLTKLYFCGILFLMNPERANLVVATRRLSKSCIQALVGEKLRGDFAGMITFPGGKLNWTDEGLENRYIGAQREFLEETGIEVPLHSLRLAGRLRLYGDRFGLIDVFHTKATNRIPTSNDEMKLSWRTIDEKFYDGMPEDTQDWLPLVFTESSFRINTAWKAGQLCMLASDNEDTPQDIMSYFVHAEKVTL